MARKLKHTRSNEKDSFNVFFRLGVDPKRGDQNIRGTVILPNGTGNEIKICVFAPESLHEELKEQGADAIGDDKLIEDIIAGNVKFDKILASTDQIKLLKSYARSLGPMGLMPSQKGGTLVSEEKLSQSLKQMKQGQIEFRVNEGAAILAKIGNVKFTDEQLYENYVALAMAIENKRPESVKGKYFKSALVKLG